MKEKLRLTSVLPVAAFFFPAAALLLTLIGQSQWALLRAYVSVTAVALLFLFVFVSTGHFLLQRCCATAFSGLDYLLASGVTGIAVLYLLLVLFGILGIFLPVPILLTITILAGFGLFHSRSLFARLKQGKFVFHTFDFFLLLFACLIAGIQFIFGWTPLIFHDFLYYHLYAPAEFLKAGSFIELPMNFSTHTPLAVQLTLASSLAFESTGQAFKLLTNMLGLLMPIAAALFVTERRAQLFAAIFTLSLPAFWIPQTLGTIDLPVASLIVLGSRWFYMALTKQNRGNLYLAGLAFGFAIGSRYQALILVFLSMLITVMYAKRTSGWKEVLHSALLGSLVVFAMTLPWFIRNYVQTGNPFFPLAYQFLGGSGWSIEQAQQLLQLSTRGSFAELSAGQKLVAPFHLVLRFSDMSILGIGVFAAALLCLFRPNCSREERLPALIGLFGLIVWGIIHPYPGATLLRFNAATLLLLFASAATVFAMKKYLVAAALILVFSSLPLAFSIMQHTFPLPGILTNLQTWSGFQEINVPAWDAFNYANQELDPFEDKILLIGETRGFFSSVPCVSPSFVNGPQVKQLFTPPSDPRLWNQKLRQLGITHILVCLPEWKRLLPRGYLQLDPEHQKKFLEWVRSQKPLYDNGHGSFVIELR